MNRFFTSAFGTSTDWMVLIIILLFGGVVMTGFIIWFTLFRKKGKKRRKNRNLRRRPNPTLEQTGGLPPKRAPDQPPHDAL